MTDHLVTAKQEAAGVETAISARIRAGATVGQEPATARKQSSPADRPGTTADSQAATAGGQAATANRKACPADPQLATSPAASIFGISIAAEPDSTAKRTLLSSRPVNAAACKSVTATQMPKGKAPQQAMVAGCIGSACAEAARRMPTDLSTTSTEQGAAQAALLPTTSQNCVEFPEASTPAGKEP